MHNFPLNQPDQLKLSLNFVIAVAMKPMWLFMINNTANST